MAMAPKKKFDFFNGGRGINLNDIYMEDNKSPPTPLPLPSHELQDHDQEEPLILHSDWGRYPSVNRTNMSSGGRSSSNSPPPAGPPPPLHHIGHSHQDYLPDYAESCLSGNQSPTGYSDHSQSGYHSPSGYSPHSPVGMNSLAPSLPPETVLLQESTVPPWGSTLAEEEDSRRKKKRHQRCRLCANHGVYVEVKGHKWYCPYRDAHNCDKCEITRKRQYYMAEQQKLTREQQQQQQLSQHNRSNNNRGHCNSGVLLPPPDVSPLNGGSGSITPNTCPRDFPRLDELVRETANIINEDLFEMINQVVRPRAKQ
ncbi:hypothetical protein SK128_019671 [Halocaridina rubra]|uniref:DM domain-containing protein n=1 Tax=Halocaridina rubra TaxID=373956 RepID=A0AAN8XTW9_HALRR